MQQSALLDRGDISQEITDGFRLIFFLQKTVFCVRYLEKLMIQANLFLYFWYIEVKPKAQKEKAQALFVCVITQLLHFGGQWITESSRSLIETLVWL